MKAIATVLAAAAAALLLALPAVAATRPHDAFNDYAAKHPGASAGWTSVHPFGSVRNATAGWT
jgi:hypothetical protein